MGGRQNREENGTRRKQAGLDGREQWEQVVNNGEEWERQEGGEGKNCREREKRLSERVKNERQHL